MKKQRRLEIQQRQEIYQWGDDPNFFGLPGFIKAENVKKLPKDVRFSEEAIDNLYSAKHKALVNLGLVKLLNAFESWENFNDYRKVRKACQLCNLTSSVNFRKFKMALNPSVPKIF